MHILDAREGAIPLERSARSDARGRIAIVHPSVGLPYRVEATFPGDALHAGSRVARDFDPRLAGLLLHLELPAAGRFDLDQREHRIQIEAFSSAGGEGLQVELLNELEDRLGIVRLDAEGRGSLTLEAERLGQPGAGRLVARSEADALRASARTEIPIVRFRATSLELSLDDEAPSGSGSILVRGALADSRGALPGMPIGLYDGAEHRRTLLTGADGRFEAEIRPNEPGSGAQLQARFASGDPGRLSSESRVLRVIDRASSPNRWIAFTAPVLMTLLLLWLLSRRIAARGGGPEERESRPGIEAGARRLRRAALHDIGGRILDDRDGEPIGGAMVTISGGSGPAARVPVSADGRFSISQTQDGRALLRVQASGYAPAEIEVQTPHRGEWSEIVVRLESHRARVMELFRGVVSRLIVSPSLWTRRTNREIVAGIPEAERPAGLEPLVERVDRACYDHPAPTGSAVQEIEAEARALEARPKPQAPQR